MKKSRLKQIRILGGFTQADIARQINIHFSTISRIENGVIVPNKTHRRLLCKFFKVDEDLLFPKGK